MKKEIKILLNTEGENDTTIAQVETGGEGVSVNELLHGMASMLSIVKLIVNPRPEDLPDFYSSVFNGVQKTVEGGREVISRIKKNDKN